MPISDTRSSGNGNMIPAAFTASGAQTNMSYNIDTLNSRVDYTSDLPSDREFIDSQLPEGWSVDWSTVRIIREFPTNNVYRAVMVQALNPSCDSTRL